MKKIVLLTLFTLIGIASAHAQLPIRFGPQIGVTIPQFDFDEASAPDPESVTGFKVGVALRVKLPKKFYIQVEPSFARLGGDIPTELPSQDAQGIIDAVTEFEQNRLDLPILFGKRYGIAKIVGLRWNLGPIISFVLDDAVSVQNASSALQGSADELKENFDLQNAQWGAQVGVGVDVWKLTLDVKYEFGLSKIYEVAGEDINYNQFVVKLGFFAL